MLLTCGLAVSLQAHATAYQHTAECVEIRYEGLGGGKAEMRSGRDCLCLPNRARLQMGVHPYGPIHSAMEWLECSGRQPSQADDQHHNSGARAEEYAVQDDVGRDIRRPESEARSSRPLCPPGESDKIPAPRR
jgi:hypothetical protein